MKVHIRDNDPVDIEADGLPEEWEDPEYNETNPGLYLVLNDDDDDDNGEIDGWDHPVPPGDDELEDVTLRFPDELKSHDGQHATVTLSLSERRFRVWYNGQLLLGGPESPYVPYGPLSVMLDHASLGPEMTVQVEFVPPPPPEPSPPYSPYVAEVPFTPISGNLSLNASDVGPRGSGSTDVLTLIGTNASLDLTAVKGPDGGALDEKDEAGADAPGWYLPANYGDADQDGWSGGGWKPDGTLNLPDVGNLTLNPTITPDKDDDFIEGGSPYLFQLVLSASEALPGKVRLVFPSRVRIWETNTKRHPDNTSSAVQSNTTEFDAAPAPKFFYVEGITGSEKLKDVLIRTTYVPANNEIVADDRIQTTVFEVTQELRFEGDFSADNQVNAATFNAGLKLGFNQSRAGNGFDVTPATAGFHNMMEARGTVLPRGTGALVQAGSVLFDYKRDVWTRTWTWTAFEGEWRSILSDAAWTFDDLGQAAEDLTPSDADHIYSIDGPGWPSHENPSSAQNRTRFVLNAREYVKLTIYGGVFTVSSYARWHSKVSYETDPTEPTKFRREPSAQQKLGTGWINVFTHE